MNGDAVVTAAATGCALSVFGGVWLLVAAAGRVLQRRAERAQVEAEFGPLLVRVRDWSHNRQGRVVGMASAGASLSRPPAVPAALVVERSLPLLTVEDIPSAERELREWLADPDHTGPIPVVPGVTW